MPLINRIGGGGEDEVKLQSNKSSVTPTKSSQTIYPDSGYSGMTKVTVNGDSDLVEGNIKKGVNIFGVTGTYSENGYIGTEITDYNSNFTPRVTFVVNVNTTNLIGLYVSTQMNPVGRTDADTHTKVLLSLFVDVVNNTHIETYWMTDSEDKEKCAEDGSVKSSGKVSVLSNGVSIVLSDTYQVSTGTYYVYPIYSK